MSDVRIGGWVLVWSNATSGPLYQVDNGPGKAFDNTPVLAKATVYDTVSAAAEALIRRVTATFQNWAIMSVDVHDNGEALRLVERSWFLTKGAKR